MSVEQVLGRFRAVIEKRHEYAREAKARTGRKPVGYLCSYVPEELVHAAGLLPLRILGGQEPQDVTEPYIYGMYCPFCRDCLAQGLQGHYDYLDGIVTAHSCVHIYNTFESWRLNLPTPLSHFIYVPAKVGGPRAQACLVAELQAFRRTLEEWTGRAISPQDIDRSIQVYNHQRRLLREVYQARRQGYPPLSGAEATEIVLAAQLMDKEEHSLLLGELLACLPHHQGRPSPGPRLLWIGGCNPPVALLQNLESLGALVVIDDSCTGSRYFWEEVQPQGDGLNAVAARYLSRPPCPQKDLEGRARFRHLLNLARDYQVQGAILFQQKFCDPHEFDIPPLKALLAKEGIPSLVLEVDVTLSAGQLRTRMEAFLEMLPGGYDA